MVRQKTDFLEGLIKNLFDGFSHIWIQMYRIDKIHIRICRTQHPYCMTNLEKPLTKIFTPVSSNQNKTSKSIFIQYSIHVIASSIQRFSE